MGVDHPVRLPRTNLVSPTNRAFYTWDVRNGTFRWAGNCGPLLNCPPWDMPPTLPAWLSLTDPDDRDEVDSALRGLLTDRQPIRLEYRLHRPDGRIIHVVVHAAFVSETIVIGSVARAAARPSLWEAPVPPTDDASAAEAERDRESTRFFDLSEDFLCVAGLDGYFRRVNPAFSRCLGYRTEELLTCPLLDFVHPDDQAATQAAIEQLSRGRPVVQFKNRYRMAHKGGYRWLEWTARSVPDEGVTYAVARDVTERVLMEQKLRFQEMRERAILDNSTAIIYVKDWEGRYEFANKQFIRLFDTARTGVIGKTDTDVFPPEYAAKFQTVDRHILRSGRTIQLQETAPHPDGPRIYESVKFPLHDEDGHVVALAGISTDITDRLRAEAAEAELRAARQVQQRLYPTSAPILPGFDVAGCSRSASALCGDYFDFIPRGDGRFVAAVGDVCGHGLGPALTMVETRAALRLLLQSADGMPAVLEQLNRHIHCDVGDSLFLSLFLAEIDPTARTLTWAAAGHAGYLLRIDGTIEQLPSTGPVLGIIEPVGFDPAPIRPLQSGDVLALFTDGLAEAMNPAGELFGLSRVLADLQRHLTEPAQAIINHVFDAVAVHLGAVLPQDDMTGIIIKIL
jgi:PAS domain S-box-containing protein